MSKRFGKSFGRRRVVARRVVLMALALTALAGAVAQEASAAGPWADSTSLANGRYDHTATALANGKVLVMGGASTTWLAAPELYDPSTNTWTATGGLSSSSARQRHTATLLPNGKVLIAGGYNSGSLNTTRIYDPATNAWTVGPNMTWARYSHTATVLPNGKVLVAGGYHHSYGALAQAELYDPLTNTWSSAGSQKVGRYQHAATTVQGGKVLVTGGTGGDSKSAELYDPATNNWTDAAAMPTGRTNHTATRLPNGTVLLAGGQDGTTQATTSVYHPATNSWSAGASMASPRYLHTATVLATGKVLVTGGFNTSPSVWNSAELYDPASDSWSPAGNLTTARTRHTATLLPDGQVLVAGGYTGAASGTNYIATVEQFATVPEAPTAVSAAAGDRSATVEWTAPATTGGAPVTSYEVTSNPGGKTATVSAPATNATVTGLTNGTAYDFTVIARNAQGESVASASSNTVTPAPALSSITVTPADPSVERGTSRQFSAEAVYSDGTTDDVTETADWSSGDTDVATVDSTGLADGRAVGSTTISASFNGVAGSTNLTVTRAQATLALGGLAHTYDGTPKRATVETTPGGLTGATVTYDGSTTPPTHAGTYAVVASLANDQYAAPDAEGTLVIERADNEVTFAPLPDRVLGADDFEVEASASSGLNVAFAAEGGCTVDGATVHLTGAGSCTITASQDGDNDHKPADPVSRRFTISPAPQPPRWTVVPDDITREATGPNGASASWEPPVALDNEAEPAPVNCSRPSDAEFPLGTTTVTCTATDADGRESSTSFDVTVKDTTAPDVDSQPDIEREATGPDGATVSWDPVTASDRVDVAVTPECDRSPGTFAVGTHTVTCSATDAHGNTGRASFTVTVRQAPAPEPEPEPTPQPEPTPATTEPTPGSPEPQPTPAPPTSVPSDTAKGTLKGAVTASGKLTLRFNGATVKRLASGRYLIVVKDNSRKLNFHLRGPGVNKTTGRPAKRGTFRWNVKLTPGRYTFRTDAGRAAGGSFRVW